VTRILASDWLVHTEPPNGGEGLQALLNQTIVNICCVRVAVRSGSSADAQVGSSFLSF